MKVMDWEKECKKLKKEEGEKRVREIMTGKKKRDKRFFFKCGRERERRQDDMNQRRKEGKQKAKNTQKKGKERWDKWIICGIE